ncbi:GspE/PulE family protein [Adhaeretor mobilis]|uniref:Type II secretion system protein E n=1 Tax=Adhaeretor mobilis TaxID=1930276 RepID=A0A517MUY1_9BACT|nr:ATPase, T2SS/T4P/T4SS family [Adhaeretor mobilis]QDS98597.1 Type II secretion system protein E [Adhaeretor mobilis]
MDSGSQLEDESLLTEDQRLEAEMALGNGSKSGRSNGPIEGSGFDLEADELRHTAARMGVEYLDLEAAEVDLGLLGKLPQKLIHRHAIFPVSEQAGTVTVATADPLDLDPLDEVAAVLGLPVIPVLATPEAIAKRIKNHLGVGSETVEGLIAARQDEDELELVDGFEVDDAEISAEVQEASVVRLVNEILIEAIDIRASDVHIESQPSGIKVRYRIDGILQRQPTPPEINHFQAAIISRLKIMARLNIAEKRLPQDGRIKLKVHGREVDVRVSVIPMLHGEGIVMRLLDKGNMEFSLEKLGMEANVRRRFDQLIRAPHGIILVTGPTGSGKTTTLYSSLLDIKSEGTKIITTEDPVEYQLEGINQIQVHSKIGLTFAQSLRAILRHDPDVVLVGEVRDFETAENAIQASLTGHLVFSTLHTNDAPSAYTRLVDMGVEPFLVASTIEAVIAQRLVRTLCRHCRDPYQPRREDLPDDFPWEQYQEGGASLYRSSGCRICRGAGFSGRQGIFEMCPTTDAVRQLAHDRASSWDIRAAAIADGMLTLRQDAWRKVLGGTTSVEEVLRVTKGDIV